MSALITAGGPVYTFNLFGFDEGFTYTGSVISVGPTATAIALDSSEAGINATVTFGQWAQLTPPPASNAGTFDAYIEVNPDVETMPTAAFATDFAEPTAIASYNGPWDTFSIHCAITDATIATVCTVSDVSGPDITSAVTAITEPVNAPVSDQIDATPVAIVITAGADKLASYDSASGTAGITSATGQPPSPGSTTSSGTKSTNSASESGSKTSSSASGSKTSSAASSSSTGGASSTGISLGGLALLSLMASILAL